MRIEKTHVYTPPPAYQSGWLQRQDLDESSGLARSILSAGHFWTHNDSGDEPNLYLIDESGADLGSFRIAGAEAEDWEDISSVMLNAEPWLFIGDVGDNRHKRLMSSLYVIREADVLKKGAQPLFQRIDFRYPDGRHDCEGVAVDPATGDVLLITKSRIASCGVYRLRKEEWDQPATGLLTAERIGSLDISKVTSFDINPDGTQAVVLTYKDAYEFSRKPHEDWAAAFKHPPRQIKMPKRRQGEAICYDGSGKRLILTSEKLPVPVWVVEL